MLAVSTPASPTAPQRARMPQRTRLLAERKRVVRRVPVPRPLGGPRDGLCVGLAPGDVGDQSERRVAPGGHAARGEEELLPCAALFALDVLHPPRPQHPLHRGRSGLWPPRGQRALVRGRPPPVQRPRRAQQPRPRAHGEDGPRLRGGGHGLQPLLQELVAHLLPHALAARHQDHVWDQLVGLLGRSLLPLRIAGQSSLALALHPRDPGLPTVEDQPVRRDPARTRGAVP
mmetsp:Transcript_6660/g.17304  ORF Transcript_6660/g.17304 Transcript_6660/m.17304 type:complete len:230 (-) Transcript_6660:322-1011(-)